MTHTDTDPDNPVNHYPPEQFPIGAALTVAYGSNERPLCTLGNLYRVIGWLTGDVPNADGQPERKEDPELGIAYQPFIPGLNDEIERCREHVEAQLPTELRALDPPPPAHLGSSADWAWLAAVTNKYGATIRLVALPGTPNNP